MATRIQLYTYNSTTSQFEFIQQFTGNDIISCSTIREYDPSGTTLPDNAGECVVINTYIPTTIVPIIRIQYSYDGGATYSEDYAFQVSSVIQTKDNYTKLKFKDTFFKKGFYTSPEVFDGSSHTLDEFFQGIAPVTITIDSALSSRRFAKHYEVEYDYPVTQQLLLTVGCGVVQKNNFNYLITNSRPSETTYTEIPQENIFTGAELKANESVYSVTGTYKTRSSMSVITVTDVAYNSMGALEKNLPLYFFSTTHSIAQYVLCDLNHKQAELMLYNVNKSLGDNIKVVTEAGTFYGVIIREEVTYGNNKLAKVRLMITEKYGDVTYPEETSSGGGSGSSL